MKLTRNDWKMFWVNRYYKTHNRCLESFRFESYLAKKPIMETEAYRIWVKAYSKYYQYAKRCSKFNK